MHERVMLAVIQVDNWSYEVAVEKDSLLSANDGGRSCPVSLTVTVHKF